MLALPELAAGATGFLGGAICGFFVRRARLCSFGAIEDALIGADWRRMRIFALALGLAILGTQLLVLGGGFDADLTTYVPSRFAWLSAALGSVMFGFGMAMVGTCAFGSIARLGGGDLRSLVVLLVFGAVSYSTLRGILAPLRIEMIEAISLQMPGAVQGSFVGLFQRLGIPGARTTLMIVLSGGLLVWALRDSRVRKAKRLLAAGAALGLTVTAGWIATGVLVDEFAGHVRPQSLTYVGPVGRTLFGFLIRDANITDFGIASVAGVAAGAFAAAWSADDFRWEAFDDPREMRRHLGGAVLMGFGGILAGGCTIGQGLTAGSLLALSWPITVAGMVVGARIGIAVLMEDGIAGLFRRISEKSRAR